MERNAAKVISRLFSNFNVAKGVYQLVLTILGLGGVVLSYQLASWSLLWGVVLVLVFITAVQTQIELDKVRHEGRGFLDIDCANSQISAAPAWWTDSENNTIAEKIRESTIEIVLKIQFRNKQPYPVRVHDFLVTLHKHSLRNFVFGEIRTDARYFLVEPVGGETKAIKKPLILEVPANNNSAEYYFGAWITIPSGMGAFFSRVRKPVLIIRYRVDNDVKRHDLRLDVDWNIVRSKRIAANTVLAYADIC